MTLFKRTCPACQSKKLQVLYWSSEMHCHTCAKRFVVPVWLSFFATIAIVALGVEYGLRCIDSVFFLFLVIFTILTPFIDFTLKRWLPVKTLKNVP